MAGKRVLVVDDDDAFRLILREALTNWGYEVALAQSGDEARSALAETPPELIILDIMMPGIDGVSFCRELRASEGTKNVPVLYVSALGDKRTVNDAVAFGGSDFIVKPADLQLIKEKIEKLLS